VTHVGVFVKLRPVSDLHLEFGPLDLPVLPREDETVLLLAGDTHPVKKSGDFLAWLTKTAPRFKQVLMVFGNHEFYGGGSLVHARARFQGQVDASGLTNVKVMENDRWTDGETTVLGCTLWTDFDHGSRMAMHLVSVDERSRMTDYKQIRTGTPTEPYRYRLKAEHLLAEHLASRRFLEKAVGEEKALGRAVVVMTHHGVLKETGEMEGEHWPAYVSDLGDWVQALAPELWLHGHTHQSVDQKVGPTRLIVNARGYAPNHLVDGFRDNWVVEVSPAAPSINVDVGTN
jgi:hypothetical protein